MTAVIFITPHAFEIFIALAVLGVGLFGFVQAIRSVLKAYVDEPCDSAPALTFDEQLEAGPDTPHYEEQISELTFGGSR